MDGGHLSGLWPGTKGLTRRGSMRGLMYLGAWVSARLNIKSERGATAVEYGIMIALIAAVIIIAVIFLGKETSRTFSCTADSLSTSTNAC
jgi:pilus assembly protein Flp/PilA